MVFIGNPLTRKGFRNNSPGMGIDSMRVAGGRCPFLIVGGLVVVCIMLLCNWWALAAENSELLRQIDELSDQLKISVEERDKCVTRLGDTKEEFRKSKGENNYLHVQLEQQNELKKQKDDLEKSLWKCNSDLHLLEEKEEKEKEELEGLKIDKNTLSADFQVLKDEKKKLKEELDKMKEECDKYKTSVEPQLQKKVMDVAELILQKPANSGANEFTNGSNTDGYDQKTSKLFREDNDAVNNIT